jgi:hypothetical protein
MECQPTFTFRASDRKHNYGEIISALAKTFADTWRMSKIGTVDLSDKNSESAIKSYLDGIERLTVKDKLSILIKDAPFSIPTAVLSHGGITDFSPPLTSPPKVLFIKPSHPFVGSADGIILTTPTQLGNEITKLKDLDSMAYVIQPSLTPVTFAGSKWDCRHFAVIVYNRLGEIAFYPMKRAIARVTTKTWQEMEPQSQITNISLQEKSSMYRVDEHMKEVHPSAMRALTNIAKECFNRIAPSLAPERGTPGYVIFGFDTIFSPIDGRVEVSPSSADIGPLIDSGKIAPFLIEVNAQPSMNLLANAEGSICKEIWEDLLGKILPWSLGSGADAPLSSSAFPPIVIKAAISSNGWSLPKRPDWVRRYGKARYATKI